VISPYRVFQSQVRSFDPPPEMLIFCYCKTLYLGPAEKRKTPNIQTRNINN